MAGLNKLEQRVREILATTLEHESVDQVASDDPSDGDVQ